MTEDGNGLMVGVGIGWGHCREVGSPPGGRCFATATAACGGLSMTTTAGGAGLSMTADGRGEEGERGQPVGAAFDRLGAGSEGNNLTLTAGFFPAR